jgi:hypothetical protein
MSAVQNVNRLAHLAINCSDNPKVEPRAAGEFEVIDKKLPLQLSVESVSILGLEAPPRGPRAGIHPLGYLTANAPRRRLIRGVVRHCGAA